MWQEKQRELAKTEQTPYEEVKRTRTEERMFYRSNTNDLTGQNKRDNALNGCNIRKTSLTWDKLLPDDEGRNQVCC